MVITVKDSTDKTFHQESEILSELKTLYWAEKQMLRILHKFEKAATTRYLKACFRGHLQATIQHVTRLETIFGLLNQKIKSKKCQTLEALIKGVLSEVNATQKKSLLRELRLIESAQKLEHFEINKYSKLVRDLNAIEQTKVAAFIEETLNEEKEAEEVFSAVMEDVYNDEDFMAVTEEANQFEAAEEE